MGFTRAELELYVGATVEDLVGPELRLLFVGINPGLWTAATQTHFAYPGNRFYPALRMAGIIERQIDRGVGMSDADRAYLLDRGIGITNVAPIMVAKSAISIRSLLFTDQSIIRLNNITLPSGYADQIRLWLFLRQQKMLLE